MSTPSEIFFRLSAAEMKVLELLCEGLTNPQIAERLYLSRRTVQSHLYNIFKKVGVASRTELVALAVRSGMGDQDRMDLAHRSWRDRPESHGSEGP